MKHVFIVHSHITYLMALSIINFKKLSKEDVCIITFNNGFNPLYKPVEVIQFNQDYPNKIIRFFNLFRNFNFAKYIDSKIANILKGVDYVLYINYAYGYNKILMTNKHCKGINFIEEGMDSYKSDTLENYTVHAHNSGFRSSSFQEKIIESLRIVKNIFRGNVTERLLLIPAHPSCFSLMPNVSYYCFSEFAFPNVLSQSKQILDINLVKGLNDGRITKFNENSIIWIGDNVVNFYRIPVSKYIAAIKKGVETFQKNHEIKSIYIKFHGSENEESRKLTEDIFNNLHIQTKIIDDSHSIELLLLNSPNCVLLGLTSSLLWYGSLIGHNSYSISRFFPIHEHLPKNHIYWSKVMKI